MTYYLFAELRSAGDRTLRIHFGELHHLEIPSSSFTGRLYELP